ncbi:MULTISPECIES: tyrosine-type recombinase/integrase [Rhizobium]|uniref:tyrosine-type recombinase/integrase n=1 Tax=Rhizobium TaxID=379 RepID=UPI001030644E|nr:MULTISPECIES: site-specific integrase [Rhizobium]TBD82032.1 site-specific integrase [Rhizobium ruizarguesonis]TBE13190.1 site-specific integrase [Rhizobium ruizarguesonis]TBF58403.1 site-specific integrase [Rhizobium leguminosarum]
MSKPSFKTEKRGPFTVRPRKRDGVLTGVWVVDIPPNVSPTAKRVRETHATKTAALNAAERMLRDLQMGSAIRGDGALKASGITFAEFAERWLEKQSDRVATGKKRSSSLLTNAYQVKALLKTFAGQDISRIVTKDIEDYQKKRTVEDGCKPPTINGEVATLVQILSWAQELELIRQVPKHEGIPVSPRKVSIPTPDEVTRIVEHLADRTGLLTLFLAETGCRKDEAFSLEWSDLDREALLVMIQRKTEFTPKSRHSERGIPVCDTLMNRLIAAKADDEAAARENNGPPARYVFPGRFGGKRTDMRKALASAVKKAKVLRNEQPIHLTMHVFRKAIGTWMAMKGVPTRVIQAHLGHAPGSRITDQVYVHITPEDHRAVIFDLSKVRPAGERAT